tara:strand:- start:182 stop:427 length:246 start_codon:yes stop_codon:yes gene_type:complete
MLNVVMGGLEFLNMERWLASMNMAVFPNISLLTAVVKRENTTILIDVEHVLQVNIIMANALPPIYIVMNGVMRFKIERSCI